MNEGRRAFLRSLPATAFWTLAGCGSLLGSAIDRDAESVADPTAWLPRPGDVDRVDGRPFGGWSYRVEPLESADLGSTVTDGGYLDRQGDFLGFDPAAVEAVAAGGTLRLNAHHPTVWFNRLGRHVFEVFGGTFDVDAVVDRATDRPGYGAADDRGNVRLLDETDFETTLAVSEDWLVRGFTGVVRPVLDAVGDSDRLSRSTGDVALVAEHLEPWHATKVRAHDPIPADEAGSGEDSDDIPGRVAFGETIRFHEDGMDVLTVRVFESPGDVDRETLHSVSPRFDEFAVENVKRTVDGRVATVSVTIPEHATAGRALGLFLSHSN